MHKKLISVLMAVGLMAGVLAVLAGPAQAAPPAGGVNFNPEDTMLGTGGPPIDTLVVSDKFDGQDNLAHFTAVGTPDTTQAIFTVCPPGGYPTASSTSVPPAGCLTLGTDTEGVTPFGGTSKAYDIDIAIPANLDGLTRDVGTYLCKGNPTNNEPGGAFFGNPNGTCLLDVEANVIFEHAQDNTASQTSSAEFQDYCLDQNASGTCTDANGNLEPGDTLPKPVPHGASVPDPGCTGFFAGVCRQFVIHATSDPSVTQLNLCIILGADATHPPGAGTNQSNTSPTPAGNCDYDLAPTSTQANATFNRYTYLWNPGTTGNDQQMAWALYDYAGGGGACADTANGAVNNNPGQSRTPSCLLDNHYVVSSAPEAASAVLTFDASPPAVPSTASCPTNPVKTRTDPADSGATPSLTGCETEQFGNAFLGDNITFESSGVGAINSCPGGTLSDTNADGRNDRCVTTTSTTTGARTITISNNAGAPGDQTITFCHDGNQNGCADETVKDTAVEHWQAQPSHVHIVYAGTGDTSSAINTCHTGDQFKQDFVNDQPDTLLICTADANENLATTENNDTRITVAISGATGGQQQSATQFTSSPPTESGQDGTTTVQIQPIRPGTDNICVTLKNNQGQQIGNIDCVQKNVRESGGGGGNVVDVVTNLQLHRKVRKHIDAKVRANRNECRNNRSVTLFQSVRGPDVALKTKTSGADGSVRFVVRHIHGSVYTKTPAKNGVAASNGDTLNCSADKSRERHV